MIKKAIKEALTEFFSSDEGRSLIVKAVKTAMIYDIEIEKHHPDDTIERIKTRSDMLAYIGAWIKNTEGAIRGCQQDIEKNTNTILGINKALMFKPANRELKQISHKD